MRFEEMTEPQQHAVETDLNCVVSAGAGSGKTGVLSERFIRLVSENKAHCNEILTLTFTRKATAEMKERIYSKLVDLNRPEELELFSSCAISTVDSLCAEIVRTNCNSYGIVSDFTTMDGDDFIKKISDIAYDFISSESDTRFVRKILRYQSPFSFAQMLAYTVMNCLDIVSDFNPDDLSSGYISQAKKLEVKQKEIALKASESFVEELGNDEKLSSQVEILKCFINGSVSLNEIVFDKGRGQKVNQERAKELRNIIKKAQSDFNVFSEVGKDSAFVKDFYSFVHRFKKKADIFKRSNSSLLFSDIMALSLDILINNREIRTLYKNRFKYVMIDEFQDNNDDYRKLIYLLSEKKNICEDRVPGPSDLEPGKIFLVGDQKQSIYRFRGADVSVFKRISEEIKLSGGELIKLDTNFRSSEKLVSSFNSVFSKVMKENNKNYEADFESLNSSERNRCDSRFVFLNCLRDETDKTENFASAELSEAFAISSLIMEMTQSDEWLLPDGKRPEYSDIAILLRQANHQASYEKALRLNGIPYSLAEPKSLTREALVNDFYNALQLCIYPYDSISSKAYSRSPLASVELQGLKDKIKDGSIASALSYIWNEMGYRYFIIGNPANQVYAEHFDYLFSLGCLFDQQGKSIVGFLDYLRPLLNSFDKFKELPVLQDEKSGVRIMTVHKSKGLEFPIVIVAGMHGGRLFNTYGFEAKKKDGMLYLPCNVSGKNSLKCLCDFDDPLYDADVEDAETKRVLYVAATRAKTHLVFSCCPSQKQLNDSDSELHTKTMLQIFLGACPFDFENRKFINESDNHIEVRSFSQIQAEQTYSTQRLTQQRIEKVKTWYDCKEDCFDYSDNHIAVTELTYSETEEAGLKLPLLESDGIIREFELQTAFGTLAHTFIENAIKKKEPPVFNDSRLGKKETQILIEDAKMLADGFLKSDLFKTMKDMDIHSEESFVVYRENRLVEGTIDFYAVNKDKVILIDFKTDMFKNPEIHKLQLEYYKDALASLYPTHKIEACIVYLRECLKEKANEKTLR